MKEYQNTYNKIDTDKIKNKSNIKTNKKEICFAIAPIISVENSINKFNKLKQYLENNLHLKINLVFKSNYSDINKLIINKKCAIGFVCTYSYVMLKKEAGAIPIAVPVINNKDVYYSYIITKRESKYKSLLDLKNHIFASSDLISTSGWLYPALYLKRKKLDPNNFFKKHIITYSHDKSILAVYNNIADAAAVDSIVFEQIEPEIKQKLKIIQKSEPFYMSPVIVHPSINSNILKKIQKLLLSMHKDKTGKKILEQIKIDYFKKPEVKRYKTIENYVNEWEN